MRVVCLLAPSGMTGFGRSYVLQMPPRCSQELEAELSELTARRGDVVAEAAHLEANIADAHAAAAAARGELAERALPPDGAMQEVIAPAASPRISPPHDPSASIC